MQEKNDIFEIFLRRSDHLAEHLRVQIEDLPKITGISRASLFGYRSGKRAITAKAWRKLEAAERAAGIPPEPQKNDPGKTPAQVREDPASHSSKIEQRLDRLESMLEEILQRMDECKKNPPASPRGKAAS